jgi:LacI family transcriptional regulator
MSVNHSFVDIDNYDIGHQAATYLYEKGCENIRLISSSQIYTYAWHKYFGVKRAAMEFGKQFSKGSDIIYDTEVESYREYVKELILQDNAPDGIICGSEISACGVIAGVQDAGKRVGEDVHIIAVETCDLPSFFVPPIPGLRQDLHSVGQKLSKFMVKQIEGELADNLQYVEKTTFYAR